MHARDVEFVDVLNRQDQYVVPPWQRRYSLGQAEERLVEEHPRVAVGGPETANYGGTNHTESK